MAATTSSQNHLWYLCPELVVLALFDEGVSDDEKSRIATALLQHDMPAQFLPGKPGRRHFEEVTIMNLLIILNYLV